MSDFNSPKFSMLSKFSPDISMTQHARRIEPPVFTAVIAQPIQPFVDLSPQIMRVPIEPEPVNVPVVQPKVTATIADARFINPNLSVLISNMRTPTRGVPRNQITVPISPSENITDELLFEEAADALKKLYIPRYRIAQQSVSGQQRYQVSLQQSEGEWGLTIHLQRFAAPAIAAADSQAREMDHRIAVILTHNQMSGGRAVGQEEMTFQELTNESGGIRAVLRGNSLAERDLLYQTLTDPAYGATLIVRHWVTVAVPLPPEVVDPRPTEVAIARRPIMAAWPVADPRPIAGNVLMKRAVLGTRISKVRLEAAGGEMAAQPTPPPPLFRQVERTFDNTVEPSPLVFPPSLHSYIFGGIAATPGQQFEMVRHQIRWRDRWHSYYQNPVRSYQFYFLPDAFKIARRPESPHNPVMSIRFTATDVTIDGAQVTLDYIALPSVDPERLAAAANELKSFITDALPPGVSGLGFDPLLVSPDKTQLRLAIPRADASAGPFDERKGATVDLRSGIHDSLTLTMPQFQAIYEAMFGGSDILFSGSVVAKLGSDQDDVIPFAARMSDLAGELFDYEEFPDDVSGGLKVKLLNAIESPVRINALLSEVYRGQARVPGQIQKLVSLTAEQLPVDLKPREDVRLLVVPSTPIPGDGPLHVAFDLDGVQVVPDKEAVWNAILDPSAPAVYVRTIKVKTFKQRFDPPADNPNNQIMALVLDFEDGESIDLNADKLESDAVLRLPIGDYVLRKTGQGQYRYKVRVIRLGAETADTDWRTDSTGILFPNVR